MGHSTNAYLYYGFDIYSGEDGINKFYANKDFDPDDNPDEVGILETLGKRHWPNYTESMISNLLGVSTGIHCSGDYPIYYIYVNESRQTAYRGYPEIVKQWTVEDFIRFRDLLKNACEALCIEYNEEADFKFRIASYEG